MRRLYDLRAQAIEYWLSQQQPFMVNKANECAQTEKNITFATENNTFTNSNTFTMRFFLIGFMASGKTTIGREVARLTGYKFIDLDEQIEQSEGQSVSAIFAAQGEDAFRRMERKHLEAVCRAEGNLIVATGGGVPCFYDNMELMNRHGMTLYLKFSPQDLKLRIQLSSQESRPLVAGKSDEELLLFVTESLTRREPYYSRAAYTLEGNDLEITERIVRLVQQYNRCPNGEESIS